MTANHKYKRIALLLIALTAVSVTQQAGAQSAKDEFAIAAGHYARSNWGESIVAFGELIRRYPDAEEAKMAEFYIGEVMMQRGEFSQAYQALQNFLRKNPRHEYEPRATFRMGEAAYRTRQHAVALRLLEDFVKRYPHHDLVEFALPYLGEIRLLRFEPHLAERAFEAALRLYPASSLSNRVRLGLAKSLQQLGHEVEAIRFYEYLIAQSDASLLGESHLQLGIIKFNQVDFAGAENQFRAAIAQCESKPLQVEATYWLARSYNELKEFGRAIELLKTVENESVSEELMTAILFDGAVAAVKTGENSLALRWLSNLRERFPGNSLVDDALRMSIDIHQRRGESNESLVLIHQFRKQHKNSPWRANVLETEGRNHYRAKRYLKTVETFDILLKENPRETTGRENWIYFKSLGHLGLGDFKQAESTLDLLDGLPQPAELKPLVQLARATAQFGSENYTDAVENFRSYLHLSPDGAERERARTELTICLAEVYRWEEAAAAFEDLNANHGDSPIVLQTAKFLGERAYQQNEIEFAELWFTFISRPGNPTELVARGLSGLAWIKMETPDTPSAHHVFERLLNECPDSKFSGEAAIARAKYLEDGNYLAQAEQTYGLVIRRFGSSEIANVAKLRRAYILQKIGGSVELEEARTLLSEYLELPDDQTLLDEALYQLGWILHDLKRPEEGRAKFAEMVSRFPKSKYWPDAAYRIVQHSVASRDYDAAKPLIEQLLKRDDAPAQVVTRVLFFQGQIAAEEKQWERVSVSMRELLSLSTDDDVTAKAKYWLAESLYRQKQYKQSLEIFNDLIPRIGKVDSSLEPWVLLRVSQCYGNNNSWIKAVETANAGIEKFPDFEADYEFDYVLGRGLEDDGKLSEARAVYKLIIDSKKGGATETAAIAQWRIGETYFHQEEYKLAIKAYHKVDSIFAYAHWRAASLIQAGKCQEHLQNNKHALKLYTQLVESFPESEFAAVAKKRIDRLIEIEQRVGKAQAPNNRR